MKGNLFSCLEALSAGAFDSGFKTFVVFAALALMAGSRGVTIVEGLGFRVFKRKGFLGQGFGFKGLGV